MEYIHAVSGRPVAEPPSRADHWRMRNTKPPPGRPVMAVGAITQEPYAITFTHEEENPSAKTETGPLVLTLQLGNKMVGRVLVDSGSTTDILYWDTFLNLGLQDNHLRPTKCILHGFSGERVRALGVAAVEMTLGNRDGPRRKELIDFVVLPVSAGYNALMGLPSICRFGAIISVPHFCLRFPVGNKIASHHGDVKQSHTCQVATETGIAQPAAPEHQPRIASLIERYSFDGQPSTSAAAYSRYHPQVWPSLAELRSGPFSLGT